ncbi:MAG TPA: serine hydrolase domain-containing protein, partial [Gemmatimonadaceae bacterium]
MTTSFRRGVIALLLLSGVAASRAIPRGTKVHPLPMGAPLAAFATGTENAGWLDGYFDAQKVAGLLVLQDGRIRLERYGLGYDSTKRWTSQSVSKSITSTLVGAALEDGYIKSLDDPVTRYIAGLRGSAYDSVTVRQLLTMTSGVRWTEVYTDTTTDTWRFYSEQAPRGMTRTVSYMRKLPREAPPGTKWSYSTGETHLLGVLVAEATKKPLSQYLSEGPRRLPRGRDEPAGRDVASRSRLRLSVVDVGRRSFLGGRHLRPDDPHRSEAPAHHRDEQRM